MLNPSEEIKSKLDIVEVIREYISLKAAGVNFRSNCPFHREKTPSFMVSPEKQIWHCFGCGKGGDVFTFVMEIEGLTFPEALRLLAKKAGVVLGRSDPRLSSQRNKLLDIIDITAKFYHQALLNSPPAEAARKYLTDRGLSEETIIEWQLGYSYDSWDSLTLYLKNKGYTENEIFLAGLSVKRDPHPGFYDRFRGRIMFPLRDVNGQAVGFTARVSPEKEAEEKMGKYINSPQTMIYNKSKILYGLDKAKLAIKSEDRVIIVEGQMDVITAHQHGFKNTIACSGTALTDEQVKLLISRYTHNLIFALDADLAGQEAIKKGSEVIDKVDYEEVLVEDGRGKIRKYIDPLLSYNANIKVMAMPTGKDPDESIKNNPGQWRQAIEEAKPLMQYYFDGAFKEFNKNNYEDQRKARSVLLPLIAKISYGPDRDFWLKKLCQEINTDEKILREELEVLIKKVFTNTFKKGDNNPAAASAIKISRELLLSELMLALIFKYPAHLLYIADRLGPDELVDEINQTIYRNLVIYYNKAIDANGASFETTSDLSFLSDEIAAQRVKPGDSLNFNRFIDWLNRSEDNQAANNNFLERLNKLALLADKDFYDYSAEQAKNEIINILTFLKKSYLGKRLSEIARLISQAEKESLDEKSAANDNKLKTLMQEFNALTEEMRLNQGY